MKKYNLILFITLALVLSINYHAISIDDNEEMKFRGFMVDAPRGIETIDHYFRLIDFCHQEEINVILFRLTDDQGSAYKFTSHPELKMCDGALSGKELKKIINYATTKGIEIIPEIESFGHSKYITESKKYEHLNDAPAGADFNALCPVNDSTLDLLQDLYVEIASIFPSKYFHIGCDEVNWGAGKKSKEALKSKSKTQIWAEYVNQLNRYIKELGKETMIWGDVPIYQHKDILDQLNNDIILIDWNYWETNHDTIKNVATNILDKGFRLIGCPAISWCEWGPRVGALQFENISAYAKVYNELNHADNLGIILSNWVPTRYLQNSQWDTYAVATHIIKNEGTANYMKVIPLFVNKHFGVNYNSDWEEIYKTLYDDIPQWKCGTNDSLIFIPWNSEEHIKKIIDKNRTVKNNFTNTVYLLSSYKDSIKLNMMDFDALLLTTEFLDYNFKRQNNLLSFVQSQNVTLKSVKNYFKQVASEDQIILSKIDSAWNIGRKSRNPGKINENYLWSFRKAAKYSKYLSENPKDFLKIANSNRSSF